MTSASPDTSEGRLSLASDATRLESNGALDASEMEKGKESVPSGDGKVEVGSSSRDLDGVKEEDGIPMVGLNGLDDPLSPINMPHWRKWAIVVVISSASFCVACCSSLVPASYKGIEDEFQISEEVATLGLSLFVLGLGFAPLVLGPLSELYGRNPIYRVAYAFFIVWNIMVAFSNNAVSFLIGRFLTGAAGAAFLSVAGGSVTDLFAPDKVGAPMAFYTASPFLGPIFGPFASGFINQHLYWRYTWYILLVWAGIEYLALLLVVPETYLPALLVAKAKALRKEGREDVKAPLELDTRKVPLLILRSCGRPFELLATEPMALLLCIWTAVLLGIMYMFFSAFSIIYGAEGYGFDQQTVGITFLGIGIGIVAGTAAHPIWQRFYQKIADETGKRPLPEEHLRKGMYGAVIVPVSLFWFAFTTYTNVHFIVSLIATIPFGIGVIWSFQAVFIYLVDAFRPIAASAMAANSALRSTFAAGFPLFTAQMFKALGTQYALMLTAFLTLLMMPFPFIFFKYGAGLRRGSKFANTA